MNHTIEVLETILRPFNMTVEEYLSRLNQLRPPFASIAIPPTTPLADPPSTGGFSWGLASPLFALGGFLVAVGCCLYWHSWSERRRPPHVTPHDPHDPPCRAGSQSPEGKELEAVQTGPSKTEAAQVSVRSQGCSSLLELSGGGGLTLVQQSFQTVTRHRPLSPQPLPPISETDSQDAKGARGGASTLPGSRSVPRRKARRQQWLETRGGAEDRQRMLGECDLDPATAIDNRVFSEELHEDNPAYVNLTVPMTSGARYPSSFSKLRKFTAQPQGDEAEVGSQSEAEERADGGKVSDGGSLSSTALYPEDHHPSRHPKPLQHRQVSDFRRGAQSQSSARSMSTMNSETLSLPSSIAKFHASRQQVPQYPPLRQPLVSTMNSQASIDDLEELSDQLSDNMSMIPNVGSSGNTQDLGYVLTLNTSGADPPPRITARHLVEILDSESPPLQGTPSNLSTDVSAASEALESEASKSQSCSTCPGLMPAPLLVSGGAEGSCGEGSDWSTGGTKGSQGSLSRLRPRLTTPPPGDESFCWDDFPFSSDPVTFHRDIQSLPQSQQLFDMEAEFQEGPGTDLAPRGLSYRQMCCSVPVLADRRHWV